jgi:hypothetical protein
LRTRSPDYARGYTCDASAYALLEEARLRCEQLFARAGTESERAVLSLIHKELGMAGWLASSEIDPDRRLALLTTAHLRSRRRLLHASTPAQALAGTAISAEDAVAEGLADAGQSDHMHLAHVHLLRAQELLAAHLQA